MSREWLGVRTGLSGGTSQDQEGTIAFCLHPDVWRSYNGRQSQSSPSQNLDKMPWPWKSTSKTKSTMSPKWLKTTWSLVKWQIEVRNASTAWKRGPLEGHHGVGGGSMKQEVKLWTPMPRLFSLNWLYMGSDCNRWNWLDQQYGKWEGGCA